MSDEGDCQTAPSTLGLLIIDLVLFIILPSLLQHIFYMLDTGAFLIASSIIFSRISTNYGENVEKNTVK